MEWSPVAERLVSRGLIRREAMERLLAGAPAEDGYLGELLEESGLLPEETYLQEMALHYDVRLATESESEADAKLVPLIPSEFALRHGIVPVGRDNGSLLVLTSNPADFQVLEDLRMLTGQPIRMVLGARSRVRELVRKAYGASVERMIARFKQRDASGVGPEVEDIGDLEALAQEPTVINLVNLIIAQAVQNRASDIHVEPFETDLRVKYRIDGILREMAPPPKALQPAIISRVKVMASMDIAERYIPQDGQIQLTVSGRSIDLRVSTVPTVYGESVVMRILDKSAVLFGVNELGFSPEMEADFLRVVRRNNGIILVTGPTGSGKTTTLYAGIHRIYSPERNFVTIEDPVEYHLYGVNQIQVNIKRGLTFATGLRHIVRQDPDVIMVGEIRDRETADIAIRAALTGHLVFSTLHTNSAAGAIARLLDMGVDPYLIASSLLGILAQRLARKICPNCKEEYTPSKDNLLAFQKTVNGTTRFYRGTGCDECQRVGYLGRTGIFEMLLLDDTLRDLILTRPSTSQIARESGIVPLREDGWRKVAAGITTVEEVLRVTEEDTL